MSFGQKEVILMGGPFDHEPVVLPKDYRYVLMEVMDEPAWASPYSEAYPTMIASSRRILYSFSGYSTYYGCEMFLYQPEGKTIKPTDPPPLWEEG